MICLRAKFREIVMLLLQSQLKYYLKKYSVFVNDILPYIYKGPYVTRTSVSQVIILGKVRIDGV
jgi:hypothetical protein